MAFENMMGLRWRPWNFTKPKVGPRSCTSFTLLEDKEAGEVALRAEMTPTLARMIAAHARNYKKPIKWFSIPQLFRYERQQKGRLREHFQLNADILGEGDPTADAELIALCIDVLRALGLTQEDFVIRLSSRHAWESFFKQRQKDTTKEYLFYQIIDKLERELVENSAQKLAEMGIDYEEVRAFIEQAEPTEELQEIIDQLQARGLKDFVVWTMGSYAAWPTTREWSSRLSIVKERIELLQEVGVTTI